MVASLVVTFELDEEGTEVAVDIAAADIVSQLLEELAARFEMPGRCLVVSVGEMHSADPCVHLGNAAPVVGLPKTLEGGPVVFVEGPVSLASVVPEEVTERTQDHGFEAGVTQLAGESMRLHEPPLGQVEIAAGGGQHVALHDNSPAPVEADQHIPADAIRLRRVDVPVGPSEAVNWLDVVEQREPVWTGDPTLDDDGFGPGRGSADGCAVRPGATDPSAVWLLGLLGLVFVRRRR